MRIDISRDDDYYTQLNNKLFPFSACNVTSGVMFLLSNGINYLNPTNAVDDDYFMSIMRSREAYEKMEILAPWAIKNKSFVISNWADQKQLDARYWYPPSEVWACLEWGINHLAARTVCKIRWNASYRDLIWELVQGRTVLTGGKWTAGGHFNLTVGLVTDQENIKIIKTPDEIELEKITALIVDDPYGNYLTGYSDHRGNSVEIPTEKYLDVVAAYRHPAYKNRGVIWGFFKI